MPSSVLPPPVTSTVPSGSNVVLWKARGAAIDATWRHAGDAWVVSRTNAVDAALPAVPLSAAVPDFRILPGWYIAALWPSRTTASSVDHVPLVRFSLEVATGSSLAPASTTVPSGTTNMKGEEGTASRAVVIVVKRPVAGSKISGRSARQVRHVWPPDGTSARPSGSALPVGYQRRYAMLGSACQLCVTGSKMFAFAAPRDSVSKPPATRMRPSGSCAWPAQNRL